jgi:hypothetical protein
MSMRTGYLEQRRSAQLLASVKVQWNEVEKGELVYFLTQAAYRDSTASQLPDLARRSTVFYAVTRDMTPSLMSLVTQEKVVSGTSVSIRMTLTAAPEPVTLLAEAVTVERSEGLKGTSYNASLKILAINREDVIRIERHLLVEKLKQTQESKKTAKPTKKR